MAWAAVFVAFFASHQVGDFLFQTDWQALHKFGGLGRDPVARRALFTHVLTYVCAYLPVSIWLASRLKLRTLIVVGVIAIPHLIFDDGRLLRAYARRVKGLEPASQPVVMLLVDQACHYVTLFGAALLVTAL